MNGSFGARLRTQRERQGVVLATIAEHTKIRLPLLEALERDDVSQWPSGIFRRSYFRAYAQAIGLDPEPAVREFLDRYPDPLEEPPEVIAAVAESATARRPRTRLHFLIESATGVLSQSLFPSSPKGIAPAVARTQGTNGEQSDAGTVIADQAIEDTDDALPTAIEPSADVDRPIETPEVAASTTCADVVLEAPAPIAEAAVEAGDESAPAPAVDLQEIARVCTDLALARTAADIERSISDAARILHAVGVIVWMWNASHRALRPSLSHGYSRETVAQLPAVRHDADNAIGAAFRTHSTQVVDGRGASTSAIVVPIVTPDGCTGILAVECPSGMERNDSLKAVAAILAAQLSTLVDATPVARTAIA